MPNPVLNEEVFSKNLCHDGLEMQHAMTTGGTLIKTLILACLMALTFAYTWYLQMAGFADKTGILSTVGVLGGFIMVLIICFGPKNNFLPITTSVYAMFEGLFLGSVSAIFNSIYPGIVPQAVLGTILAIFGMYLVYSSKVIKNMDMFRKVVIISTFAVCGIYLLQLLLGLFGYVIPGIFSNGIVGIVFSLIVVAIAAFNLIVDFDFIDQYSGNVPSYFEWYGGFSLMVTIVWLYLEILKLLAKSRR
ncbi:Bax inhibitor-1/YccA family protein [bacterium]|nr:Bax inhibitor-1/YccA family protein [bacterium]